MQASAILGPLIGGILIGPLGTGWLLIVTAGMYAISGLGSGQLRPLPAMVGARTVRPLESLRDGLRYVAARPVLRSLLLGNAALTVFASSYPQFLPAVAHDTLRAGAVELSWLVAGSGLGALSGSLALTTMRSWRRLGLILIGHALATGIALVVFGMQRAVPAAVAMTALLGWLSVVYVGGTGTIIQMNSSNEFRGCVLGFHATIFHTGVQLGTLLLGVIGSLAGVGNALALGRRRDRPRRDRAGAGRRHPACRRPPSGAWRRLGRDR